MILIAQKRNKKKNCTMQSLFPRGFKGQVALRRNNKYSQYKILCERIKNRQGVEFLWEVSPGRTAWRIEYRAANRPLVAVYDDKAGLIVTFLPIADLKKLMSENSEINAI